MCRAVRCKTCGKTTWAGCGQHVTAVRAAVPPDQWCSGHPQPQKGTGEGSMVRRWLSRSRA